MTAGPDLTFVPASNFAAESPAALPGHGKFSQMGIPLLYYIWYGTYIIKKGESRKYNRNLAT